MINIELSEKGQALAPATKRINASAFKNNNTCEIYWLGGGGAMINSYGTIIMIDPVLAGFDMPLLREVPILPEEVLKLDALLITHIDSDHFSHTTCQKLGAVCKEYHSTHYVAGAMQAEGINSIGHDIGESFQIGDMKITLTKTKHNWQNEWKEYQYRKWEEEEYCGYLIEVRGKSIWMPGDSKLIKEHLCMNQPDVILFDFSEDDWHITLDGAVKLANSYPESELICIHYGCIDAPDMAPFNGNPMDLFERVVHPERIKVLAPGEQYILK